MTDQELEKLLAMAMAMKIEIFVLPFGTVIAIPVEEDEEKDKEIADVVKTIAKNVTAIVDYVKRNRAAWDKYVAKDAEDKPDYRLN